MSTIVTYCSAGFEPCLNKMLPSWQLPGWKVVVYTDTSNLNLGFKDAEIRPHFDRKGDDPLLSWDRKILALEHFAISADNGARYLWLDSDCWLTRCPQGIFDRFAPRDVTAAGRLVGRCIRGQAAANAGVIPLQATSQIYKFFEDWKTLSTKLKGNGPITTRNKWHEQHAFSRIVIDAFDGHKPYGAGVYSENLYNLEDDNTHNWTDRIRRNKPAILHWKNNWWKRYELWVQLEEERLL